MRETYDAAVIGAGIAGVPAALHLLLRGKKVILIDRRGLGQETSYGPAGFIETSGVLPYPFPPLSRALNILLDRDAMARVRYRDLPKLLPWIADFYFQSLSKTRKRNGASAWPLVVRALDEHRTLMRGTDAERYLRMTGRVTLYRTESAFAASAFERKTASEMGVPFDVMDAAAFGEIEPHLKPAYIRAINWKSSARSTNPGAIVTAYGERFVREGGTLLRDEVKALSNSDGLWQVETSGGGIRAHNIIICTGPWATDLLKPLGYHFPLGIKRGYHRHYAALGAASLSYAIVDVEYGYVLAPMEQGYRVTTGAEFADRDAPPNPAQLARVLPHARELFPLGEPVDAEAWCGSRPCFTDSLPVIGAAARHKGLWFNFGHGHMGFTIGPSSGRLLAEMMTGAPTFCDPAPYRAGRFGC